MKKTSIQLLICVVLVAIAAIAYEVCTRSRTPRNILFDDDWLFIEGSHPEAIAGDLTGGGDTATWQHVDLPHDFSALARDRRINGIADSIESIGPFAKISPGKAATGWTLGGEGWYVKRFTVRNELFSISNDRRVQLYFEGAYNQAHVWVNGHEVGSNMYGYSAFRFDITPYLLRDAKGHLDTDAENIIAVQVLNQGKNSRWYAGTGLYRHVWLQITDPLHLDTWRTFVQTSALDSINADGNTAQRAELTVYAEIADSLRLVPDNEEIHYELQLLAPDGNTIEAEAASTVTIEQGGATICQKLSIAHPQLWCCQQPTLYTLYINIRYQDHTDHIEIPVGIRSIEYTADRGFMLNGRPTLLRGACIHHDNGLLGARAYDRAEQRKIQLLRQAGFNAIRGSHNPMSEALMAECDRQGMLVIDEAFDMWHKRKNKQDYHQYFDSLSTHDLQTLVRRDRNHPSVIMYSIGNEIPERADSLGVIIAARLRSAILDLDDTRAVTMGINSIWNKDRTARLSIEPACRSLDVAGYNYRVWNYEPEHIENPGRVMYGSETVLGELASDWRRVVRHPWVIGDFVWTGMDYIGEAGIANCLTLDAQENVHFFMPWPWYNGWCGNLDLIGQPKAQAYYQAVVCGDVPIAINVEPSRYRDTDEGRVAGERPSISYWGWMDEQHQWYQPGCEGDSVRVNVYSRDTLVTLYLDDQWVADVQVCDTTYMGHALVPYRPGTLRAETATSRQTSAAAILTTPHTDRGLSLRLTPDRTELRADGQDLSYILIELVDAEGHLVPETGRTLTLQPSPAQQMIGSGNAQPDDMRSFGSLTPTLFHGQAMAIIRATRTPGTCLLKVAADGLNEQAVTITCR